VGKLEINKRGKTGDRSLRAREEELIKRVVNRTKKEIEKKKLLPQIRPSGGKSRDREKRAALGRLRRKRKRGNKGNYLRRNDAENTIEAWGSRSFGVGKKRGADLCSGQVVRGGQKKKKQRREEKEGFETR